LGSKDKTVKRAPRVEQMRDLAGVLKEMRRVYVMTRKGELTPAEGSKLTYILKEIRETLGPIAIEEKVAELREKICDK